MEYTPANFLHQYWQIMLLKRSNVKFYVRFIFASSHFAPHRAVTTAVVVVSTLHIYCLYMVRTLQRSMYTPEDILIYLFLLH